MERVTIIPTRACWLDGQGLKLGQPVQVRAEAAELALRHGWAKPAPEVQASKPAAKKQQDKG